MRKARITLALLSQNRVCVPCVDNAFDFLTSEGVWDPGESNAIAR